MPDSKTTKRMFIHMINMMKQHSTMTISCGDPLMSLLEDVRNLLDEQQEQIDKLLEESASNEEMAEGMKELLKEQEAVLAHWDDDTGHWIEGDRNGIDPHTRTTGEMIDTFRCSWCGFYQYWKTPFCPNCGAKMEGR